MADDLSQGISVEAFEPNARPMEGVTTSVAGFTGLAVKGPVGGAPQLVTNMADFRRQYGGYLSEDEFGNYRFLAYAVEHFFLNGGGRAFISRVAPSDAAKAKSVTDSVLTFHAANAGAWGNGLHVIATPASKAGTQVLKLTHPRQIEVKNSTGFYPGDVIVLTDGDQKKYNRIVKIQGRLLDLTDDYDDSVVDDTLTPQKILSTCEFRLEISHGKMVELYENLSFNANISDYIQNRLGKSALVTVETKAVSDQAIPPFSLVSANQNEVQFVCFLFEGGFDGSVANLTQDSFIGKDNGPGKRTGIQAFIDNDSVSIVAVPGVTDPAVQVGLIHHCESLNSRFAVLDMPRELNGTDAIVAYRELFDSVCAAMYHPWLLVYSPLDKRNIAIPPSGSVAGIYAHSDNMRGVHKAPANEVVRGCVGLDTLFNKGEQDILNPRGVNLIRSFPGQGIRVWGARTCSSNSLWKYVNVRRLYIFVEESIKANTNWVVFEPNDETLWKRVKRTIEVFLNGMWRGGALMGSSPGEAFFVDVGHTTMTQEDINNGRLICVIGIAAVRPAEFTIFRITQHTASE